MGDRTFGGSIYFNFLYLLIRITKLWIASYFSECNVKDHLETDPNVCYLTRTDWSLILATILLIAKYNGRNSFEVHQREKNPWEQAGIFVRKVVWREEALKNNIME